MSADSDRAWQPPADAANAIRQITTQKLDNALQKLSSCGEALMRIPELTQNLVQRDGNIPLHPIMQAVADYKSGPKTLEAMTALAEVLNQWQPAIADAYARADQAPVVYAASGAATMDEVLDISIAVNDVISAEARLKKLPPVPPAVDRKPDMEEKNGLHIWFKE